MTSNRVVDFGLPTDTSVDLAADFLENLLDGMDVDDAACMRDALLVSIQDVDDQVVADLLNDLVASLPKGSLPRHVLCEVLDIDIKYGGWNSGSKSLGVSMMTIESMRTPKIS